MDLLYWGLTVFALTQPVCGVMYLALFVLQLTIEKKLNVHVTGFRMRSAERLRAKLQDEDAMTEADEFGLNLPTTTSELLQQANQAFSEYESVTENHEEEIEEEVVYEWENLDEFLVE